MRQLQSLEYYLHIPFQILSDSFHSDENQILIRGHSQVGGLRNVSGR